MVWKIRDIEIKNQVVVAPMAGVTNIAFRQILKSFGAGLIYTEMVSDKGLGFENHKTFDMLDISPEEHPISLQLFGSDVDSLVHAAMILDRETDCDIIDINMGCPVNKVTKTGAGSALLKDSKKIYDIVSSVVKSVRKPVTVKIRSGWTHEDINAVEVAKVIENAGASAITVHPRTRSDMYSGHSDWNIIKAVKLAVSIPVIGNGDIYTPEDAKNMLEETGCDAVMIARGLLGNPWLIKQSIDFIDTGKYSSDISIDERFQTIKDHLHLLVSLKGEKVAVLEMRSHGPWYLKGLPAASITKSELARASTVLEIENILSSYFISLKNRLD